MESRRSREYGHPTKPASLVLGQQLLQVAAHGPPVQGRCRAVVGCCRHMVLPTRKSPVVRGMACPLSTVTRLAPVRHVRVVANAVDRMEAAASAVAIMCARIVPQRALRRPICNVYHARPSLPHMDRRRSKLASMGQGRDSQHRMGSVTTTHAPGYPVRAQEAPAHQVPLGACESLRGPLPLQLGQ